jgi:DNA polymerase-3 subunit epsilon
MRLPFGPGLARRRTRAALAAPLRARLAALRRRERGFARQWRLRATPLPVARFVALDLETTGPRMDRDRVIAVGAVAVRSLAVAHDDAFEAILRQAASSTVDNILVHQIGGQQQLAGADPAAALVEFLEFRAGSVLVAFRAEFDATVLSRELELRLGIRVRLRALDLAVLLPALFPGTQNDTLEDWLRHFGIEPIARHCAIADAYSNAQLLLPLLAAARRHGARTVADLYATEAAQRWLGRRR